MTKTLTDTWLASREFKRQLLRRGNNHDFVEKVISNPGGSRPRWKERTASGILSAKYLKLAKKMMFFSISVYTARSVRKNNSQELVEG